MPALALTDLERRTIAHLGQPRNVTELASELRRDAYTRFGAGEVERTAAALQLTAGQVHGVHALETEQEMHAFLEELAAAGLVVNLGEHSDASKAAGAHRKGALRMPDEQARIFEARLAAPHRAWRLAGDLWMLSEAGLEMLHAPPPGVSGAMAERAAIERMLAEHASAVLADVEIEGSIFDERGGELRGDAEKIALCRAELGQVATLLPEEYRAWADQVVAAWQAQHPDEPALRLPVAGGAGYGDATEDLIQAADAGGTAYGETAPTFYALTTVAVTDTMTGSTITEANYTGYARKSTSAADLGTSTAGSRTNANAIVWAGATAGTSTVIGHARCTTSGTGTGRVVRYGTCASTVVSATQTPPQFAVGALADTLD